VHEKFQELKNEFHFDSLSMGMSDDMESAIAEGANAVRIAARFFGARKEGKGSAA